MSPKQIEDEVLIRTSPSVKPTAVALLSVLLAGGGVIGYLLANPRALGTGTGVVVRLVGLIVAVASIGLTGRMLALRRTEYLLTRSAVHRRYQFFMKERHRKLPLSQLRGYELSQGRFEWLFGYGTVRFLSGGTNRSLGFVAFDSIPEPRAVRDHLRELL